MDLRQTAAKIEYSLLDPFAGEQHIRSFCEKAQKLGLAGVCVLPSYVAFAHDILRGTDTKVICVVSYPHGMSTTRIKIAEAQSAVKDGADELELMMNHAALFDNDEYFIANEVYAICKKAQLPVRLMLEASVLDMQQLDRCSKLAWDNGAEMLVLRNGAGNPPEESIIASLRQSCKKSMRLKIFGGVEDADSCLRLLAVGADLIGTVSPEEILKTIYQKEQEICR